MSIHDIDDQFVARWHELAENALEPTPFAEPDFQRHAAKAWPGGSALRLLVASDDDGRFGMLLPYIRAPYELRGLRFITASSHPDYLTRYVGRCYPLVRKDDPARHIGAVLHALGTGQTPGALALSALPESTVGAAILAVARDAGISTSDLEGESRWRYPADPGERSLDVFDPPAGLSSGHRRGHRKRAAALAETAGGELRVEDWSSRPDVADVFADFQAQGWKADAARGGDGLVLHPERLAAFRSILADFASRGRLRVMAVCGGDEVLYMSVNLGAAAGGWFGFYDAYSEKHRRLSPGTIGRHAVLRTLRQGEAGESVDPLLPMSAAAAASADGEIRIEPTLQILVVRSGARARALLTLMAWRRRLRRHSASPHPESTRAETPGMVRDTPADDSVTP
ncbi:GNAT family N-acetyltransferase [Demequina aestuarii]|uniref:GNAT family N-acetyltransferase n=1 Tax=Demequina aestuarii TaxID=327095 RepID=UPI00187CCF1A|nr:GNAT family N-acetyltransferase [Demequina aestuarii]